QLNAPSNRALNSGTASAGRQKTVRLAYEKTGADVRSAGFDFKRGGPLLPGQTAAPWATARPYSAGTIVTPIAANGHTYRATNGGTSGGTEPSPWPTGTRQPVVAGGALAP